MPGEASPASPMKRDRSTYRYSVTGEITFGAPQYENEYAYNGESYNPNIESQYLRARYYCVVTATFLTEDSYLGSLTEPLTLNRYNYCVSSYLNYTDPSGNSFENASDKILAGYRKIDSLGHELIIAVNSFSSGVSGSISKSNMDKMAGVIAVGEMLERMFGIRVSGSMSILWTQKVELFSQHNICRENYFLGC